MSDLPLTMHCNRGHVPITYEGGGACPLCTAIGANDADASFERFWREVPYKTNRARAYRVWQRMSQAHRGEAIAGMRVYRLERIILQTYASTKDFVPSVKYAEGWLRDKRWSDPSMLTAQLVSRIPCKRCGITGHDSDQGKLDPYEQMHERCKR